MFKGCRRLFGGESLGMSRVEGKPRLTHEAPSMFFCCLEELFLIRNPQAPSHSLFFECLNPSPSVLTFA